MVTVMNCDIITNSMNFCMSSEAHIPSDVQENISLNTEECGYNILLTARKNRYQRLEHNLFSSTVYNRPGFGGK